MSRRFSAQEKLVAVEIWCGGKTLKETAEECGISRRAIVKWKSDDDPVNWDLHRADIIAEAKEATRMRILGHQEKIHETHFNDLERIRQSLLRSMATEKKQGGVTILIPRQDLQPKDIQRLASAYLQIQKGRRLALGIPSDYTIIDHGHGPVIEDPSRILEGAGIDTAHLKQIGDAAAEIIGLPMLLDDDEIEAELEDLADE